jgi:hypothetical protein
MSGLGTKRTCLRSLTMSALEGRTDMSHLGRDASIRPRLCENAPEPRTFRVSSPLRSAAAPTSAIGFRSDESRWNFYAQVPRLSFHTALDPSRKWSAHRSIGSNDDLMPPRRCQPQSLWRRTLLLARLDCHARRIPAWFATKRRLPNRFRALLVLQHRIEPPIC